MTFLIGKNFTKIKIFFQKKTKAFGADLSKLPLHLQTLADLEIEYRSGLHFLVDVLRLFGANETNKATPEEQSKSKSININQSKSININQSKSINISQSKSININQSKSRNINPIYKY